MNIYEHSTGIMELGTTASGALIYTLKNKEAAGGKTIILKRLKAISGFSGTAASTAVTFGITKIASGTPAAGSTTVATSNIGQKNGHGIDSIAELRYGPTPITGPTDPTAAKDHKCAMITHQNGYTTSEDLYTDQTPDRSEPFVLKPGEILAVYTRSVSVAGSKIGFDTEWGEV